MNASDPDWRFRVPLPVARPTIRPALPNGWHYKGDCKRQASADEEACHLRAQTPEFKDTLRSDDGALLPAAGLCLAFFIAGALVFKFLVWVF